MPEGEALKKSFVEKVSKLYIAYLEELRRAEADRGDPDTAGAQPRFNDDEAKSVRSQITEDASEFGGGLDFYANFPAIILPKHNKFRPIQTSSVH